MASSEFLINKNQGDWAEDLILSSFPLSDGYIMVKYGRAGDKVAGEEGFERFYAEYQNELDEYGKRPDLLIFRKQDYTRTDTDLSSVSNQELLCLVPRAVAGLEVRSSSFLNKKYKPGKSSNWESLSFTAKVEDIVIVLKWIEQTGVPHYYVQVPFDEAHIISFHKILQLVSDQANKGKLFAIDRDVKNQFKTVIKVPLGQGTKVGDVVEAPRLEAKSRELENGRLLFYVGFHGGKLNTSAAFWEGLMNGAEKLKTIALNK